MDMLKQIFSLLWERKILLLATVLLLIVFILVGLLLFQNTSQTQEKTGTNNSTSPTVAPQLNLTQAPVNGAPTIFGIAPIANSKNISLFTSIRITFSGPLTPAIQNDISVTLSPSTPLSPLWQNNSSLIIETPTVPLKPETSYQVTVMYKKSTIKQWYFATIPDSKLSTADQAKLQSVGDKANADYWKNVTTSYPWYNSLPLQTTDYFVYFDLQKKSFKATIYPKPTTDQQVAIMKTEVTNALSAKGVPLDKLPIEWKIK